MNELPKRSSPLEDVIGRLREMQTRDGDYHNARTWSLIYNAGPDVDAVLQAAASEVLLENALNPAVFPSLKEMQRDIVSMSAHLLNGGDDAGGAVTSGGPGSVCIGVKAARDRMRAEEGSAKGRTGVPRRAHRARAK